mgnify:CR=1 FL=1|nr:MAG TPA: SOS-response transcriptional repressor [Caudoviricetes sp.]
MYRNLKAEIARTGMSGDDCAKAIGKSLPTFYRLIGGIQEWRLSEMIGLSSEIKRRDGKGDLDYLFEDDGTPDTYKRTS